MPSKMTREFLRAELDRSERGEAKTYKDLTLKLFRELQAPLKALYDETVKVTDSLTKLTADILQSHPRVIKILRYCLAPVVSQMRLGQLIDADSTEAFEEQGVRPTSDQAERLAQWCVEYLDRERFPWLTTPALPAQERTIAANYAKLWTVSLVSNQNTATKYRNQRKEQQEAAIRAALTGIGLKYQPELGAEAKPTARAGAKAKTSAKRTKLGGIDSVDDVRAGHFVAEKKILGGSQKKQKADLTARPSAARKLFCIEAKAVGIRIDSTKRLKELNDKYTDWNKSKLPITTVGVIAGFFNEIELIATIQKRGIALFFEHDLGPLTEFLQTGNYFGAPWKPAALFPDVADTVLKDALSRIERTSTATE